jgi:hypothetical protein
MMPSLGRIVLYHFENLFDNGAVALRARPAVVVDADGGGVCELHVFFSVGDQTMSETDGTPDDAGRHPDNLDVRPHQELRGEVGKIERQVPLPGTWSWPPRVG